MRLISWTLRSGSKQFPLLSSSFPFAMFLRNIAPDNIPSVEKGRECLSSLTGTIPDV
jgi:hypothetical protein